MQSAAAQLPRPGDKVLGGRYRIERVLGRGGMGVVLAARHELLDQPAALKLLLPEVMNEDTTRRFLHEARASVRIRSNHVATVIDVGTLENGIPFILMELLEGRDLGKVLREMKRLSVSLAVDYCIQALEALSAAHALQIVHRDLKPSNLFVAKPPDGAEVLKVLDFGISKSEMDTSPDMAKTSTRALLGSPLYISPEQFRSSRTVDARADQWAMGIILHELLAGAPPFWGETLGEVFIAILEQPLTPVRAFRPDVPPELEQIIVRCLQRDREARFANVAELAYALAPFGQRDARQDLERMRGNLAAAPVRAPSSTPALDPGAPHTPAPYTPDQAGPPAYVTPAPSQPAAEWRGPMTPTPAPVAGFTPPPQAGSAGFSQSASAQRAWTAPPDTRPGRAGIIALALAGVVVLVVAVAGTMSFMGPRRAATRPVASASASALPSTSPASQAPEASHASAVAPLAPPNSAAPADAPDAALAALPTPPPKDDPPATRPTKPSGAGPSRVVPTATAPTPPGTSILDKRR